MTKISRVFNKFYHFFNNSFNLIIFNVYIFVETLMSTELILVMSQKYLEIARAVLFILLALSILKSVIKNKFRITKNDIIFGFLVILSLVNLYYSKIFYMLVLSSFMYALKDVDFKKVLQTSSLTLIILYLFTLFMVLINVYPNTVSIRWVNSEQIKRYTLGFNAATLTQSLLFFIYILRWGYKGQNISIIEMIFFMIVNYVVYRFTDGRTGYFLLNISVILSFILKFKIFNNLFSNISRIRFVSVCVRLIPIFILALGFYTTFLYYTGSELGIQLNDLLSGRLSLQVNAFKDYGFTLFGTDFLTIVNGGYRGVDNGLLFVYFNYGLIFLIIYVYMYSALLKKAIDNKNIILTSIIILVLIDSFVEPYVIDMKYNAFVLLFANLIYYKANNLELVNEQYLDNIDCYVKKLPAIKVNNMKKTVAVVVTFNRKELLRESLEALKKQLNLGLSILVVDNNSTDGTYDFIKDLIDHQAIIYKNTGKNLGGSGGFNYGIKEALKLNPNYVWIMDDDCIVKENTLDELLFFARKVDNQFGYLSSKVEWTDSTPCVMNVQRKTLAKEITDFSSDQEVLLASFVSLFINVDAIYQKGLPIKDFFIWGDDWEYTYRLASSYKCYYVAKSVVTHKCAKNIGVNISSDEQRLDRYFYAYRNEKYFYYHAGLKGRLYYFLKLLSHRIKIMLSSSDKKKEKLAIIKKGLTGYKNFKPKVEFVYPECHEINAVTFFAEPISYGGQEAFMLNMYRSFGDNNIKHTVVSPFYVDNKNFIELKEQNKLEIISYNHKFDTILRKYYVISSFKKLLKEKNIDVIHIQSGSLFALYRLAKLAKNASINKVIIHSHCAGKMNFKYRLIKTISDFKINKYVDNYLACSHLAAEWKFPKEILENDQYSIINNGIDLDQFNFDETKRNEYRANFKLTDEFVLCNVGRFSEQKNHAFIVELCDKLAKNNFNFKCILVGQGELKEKIINMIKEKNILDKFIILESRSDIAQIMMASDCFILPSLYEGLAVTSVESQATGLYTICSTDITQETNFSDIIEFIPTSNIDLWISAIMNVNNKKIVRTNYADIIRKAGYSSKDSAKKLELIYRGLLGDK